MEPDFAFQGGRYDPPFLNIDEIQGLKPISRCKINLQRLSAIGYSATRPLVPNNSSANRSKNRRVEIVLATEGER
jgi:hypothetical protein